MAAGSKRSRCLFVCLFLNSDWKADTCSLRASVLNISSPVKNPDIMSLTDVDVAGAASRGRSEFFSALLRTFYSHQPQTHKEKEEEEEEEDTKATGCYSPTDRNQQKPDIALDFFNLACFCTLSPCIIMFTSCVHVKFSKKKMYALFLFFAKASVLCFYR